MATCSNMLAWRIAWTEKPGGLQFMGSQRVGHNLATEHTHTHRMISRAGDRNPNSFCHWSSLMMIPLEGQAFSSLLKSSLKTTHCQRQDFLKNCFGSVPTEQICKESHSASTEYEYYNFSLELKKKKCPHRVPTLTGSKVLLMCPWTQPIFDFGLITEFRKTGRNPEGACMNVDSYIQTWDIRLSISFTFI